MISFRILILILYNIKTLPSRNNITKPYVVFKYFFIQIVGSIIILFSYIISFYSPGGRFVFIMLGVSLKIRVFPRHMWVVELYSILSFWEIFFIRCIPKIPPILFFYLFFNSFFLIILFISLISIFISVMRGFKAASISQLFRYSGIINIS